MVESGQSDVQYALTVARARPLPYPQDPGPRFHARLPLERHQMAMHCMRSHVCQTSWLQQLLWFFNFESAGPGDPSGRPWQRPPPLGLQMP
eukprot:6076403-Pyramimonas_sp.AAC.1